MTRDRALTGEQDKGKGSAQRALADPQAGLTLVEVVVALALGAVVVAFLAQGAGLIRHFVHLGRSVSAQDETLAIRDHLRRTIESALGRSDASRRDTLAGVADTAVFTVPGDRLLERGGPVRIMLAAIAERNAVSLVETRTSVGDPPRPKRTRRLLTGAFAVRLSYRGATGGDGWLSEWTDPEAEPILMRIEVAFPPGDVRRWPPFVVLIPTGGTAPAGRDTPAKADTDQKAKPG